MILFPIELERLGVGRRRLSDDLRGRSIGYLPRGDHRSGRGRPIERQALAHLDDGCLGDPQPRDAGADGVRFDLVAVHRPACAASARRWGWPDAGVRGRGSGCPAGATWADGEPRVQRRHPRLGGQPADGRSADPGQPIVAVGARRRPVRGGRPLLLAADRGLLDPFAAFVQHRQPHLSPRTGLAALRPSLAGPRSLLDRLHFDRLPTTADPIPARRAGVRFTGREVAAALAGRLEGPRAQSALEMAARPVRWMPADSRQAFRDVPRFADRVPTILSQLRNGADPEEIGRRISPLSGSWPVQRTIEIASDLIARELNRQAV